MQMNDFRGQGKRIKIYFDTSPLCLTLLFFVNNELL